MKVAQEIKGTAAMLDSLLVATPLDHRVRKIIVDAIMLLRIATEIQIRIERHEIPFELQKITDGD